MELLAGGGLRQARARLGRGPHYVANGLDLERGDEVLTTDEEHPSGLNPWLLKAKRYGIAVKQVTLSSRGERVLDQLAEELVRRTAKGQKFPVPKALGADPHATDAERASAGWGPPEMPEGVLTKNEPKVLLVPDRALVLDCPVLEKMEKMHD